MGSQELLEETAELFHLIFSEHIQLKTQNYILCKHCAPSAASCTLEPTFVWTVCTVTWVALS